MLIRAGMRSADQGDFSLAEIKMPVPLGLDKRYGLEGLGRRTQKGNPLWVAVSGQQVTFNVNYRCRAVVDRFNYPAAGKLNDWLVR